MLGFEDAKLKTLKAEYTAEEIAQQPATWKKTRRQLEAMSGGIKAFIKKTVSMPDFDVLLTGAGTSEYVGNALCPVLAGLLKGHVRSAGTTDIVASPHVYLSKDRPTLMVSFARSGNSPESVGAVEAADAVCGSIAHLFITCNEKGALAEKAKGRDDVYSIVLTPETHDRGFAMTSSFSNMYLAALLAFAPEGLLKWDGVFAAAEAFLEEGYKKIKGFTDKNSFSRIVYLGTDVLKGIAQESALKVLELTAGKMVALHDTPMGFRHGPKSVVNDDTVCVVYLSDEPRARRYEMDLLAELYRDKKGSSIIAVMNGHDEEAGKLCDLAVCMDAGCRLENAQLALLYILAAQIIALMYSIELGITPDDPCPTGEVNRVVKGVTIYPMKEKESEVPVL